MSANAPSKDVPAIDILNARKIKENRAIPIPSQIWQDIGYEWATTGGSNMVTNLYEDTLYNEELQEISVERTPTPILLTNKSLADDRYLPIGKERYTLSDAGREGHLETRVPDSATISNQFDNDDYVFYIAYKDMIGESESAVFVMSETLLAHHWTEGVARFSKTIKSDETPRGEKELILLRLLIEHIHPTPFHPHHDWFEVAVDPLYGKADDLEDADNDEQNEFALFTDEAMELLIQGNEDQASKMYERTGVGRRSMIRQQLQLIAAMLSNDKPVGDAEVYARQNVFSNHTYLLDILMYTHQFERDFEIN